MKRYCPCPTGPPRPAPAPQPPNTSFLRSEMLHFVVAVFLIPDQWFYWGGFSPPQGAFGGDIWGHFGYRDLGDRGDTGMEWVEIRDSSQHPTMHKTASCDRELSSPKYQWCGGLRNLRRTPETVLTKISLGNKIARPL